MRPDGYVAWTSPGTTDDLTQALERWFTTGPRPPARGRVTACGIDR
ncbi:hypothetical protein [Streptomyces sp. NPDC060027]